jgi:pimeloyl-ACP methyl ester carboxylesterase
MSAAGLKGSALLPEPWTQDSLSWVSEATLLRGFDERLADVDGIRTRYFVGGAGPPLVIVHGLGGAAVNFSELAPLLARRYRVLIPDLAGHGRSRPFGEIDGLTTYANHVAAVAEREGMLPANVLGYSMGGVVALRLAVARPDDVTALVLAAAAGIVSTTRRAVVWFRLVTLFKPGQVMTRFREGIARRPRLRWLPFGLWGAVDPPSLSPRAVIGFLEAASEHTDTTAAGWALLEDDPRPDLDRVRCPVLLLWGARDRLVPLADGFEYARRLRAPIRTLPAAGHLLIGEQPDECAAIVTEFLDRTREGVARKGDDFVPGGREALPYARFGV